MKTYNIDNWAFAHITRSCSAKCIIALLGTVDGNFFSGSSHIVKFDRTTRMASTGNSRYVLREVDKNFAAMEQDDPYTRLTAAVIANTFP